MGINMLSQVLQNGLHRMDKISLSVTLQFEKENIDTKIWRALYKVVRWSSTYMVLIKSNSDTCDKQWMIIYTA